MKKIAFVACVTLMSSGIAFGQATGTNAADVCAGAAAAPPVTKAATPLFIQQDFTARCSNNVYLSYKEDAQKLGVASSSKKGKSVFSGGSGGGGITGRTCTTLPCSVSETTSEAATAYTNTSS